MAILKRTDKKRFGNLVIQLKNSFLLKKDEFPTKVSELLKVMNNYKPEWKNGVNPGNNHQTTDFQTPTGTGVSLLQTQTPTPRAPVHYVRGTNNSFYQNITCRICGFKGHYQSHCPIADLQGNKITTSDAASSITDQEVRSVRVSFQLSQYADTNPPLNPY